MARAGLLRAHLKLLGAVSFTLYPMRAFVGFVSVSRASDTCFTVTVNTSLLGAVCKQLASPKSVMMMALADQRQVPALLKHVVDQNRMRGKQLEALVHHGVDLAFEGFAAGLAGA